MCSARWPPTPRSRLVGALAAAGPKALNAIPVGAGPNTLGQQAPGSRRGGHGAERIPLVAQQGRVRCRLTAFGEHHREIDRDPAGVVPGARCHAVAADAARP